MSNVKQNVINIVMGLPPVEPEVTVAVPAEMTVEQAREVLSNPIQLSTSVKDLIHPEPSEDPTGYSGFSGEPKLFIKFKTFRHKRFPGVSIVPVDGHHFHLFVEYIYGLGKLKTYPKIVLS